MLYGLTRFLSRIKLTIYVMKHKDWKCLPLPTCWCCEYWETCWYEHQVEHDILPDEPNTETQRGPKDSTEYYSVPALFDEEGVYVDIDALKWQNKNTITEGPIDIFSDNE